VRPVMLGRERLSRARGMSLVELMVGLTVGLIVILATLAMYTTTSIGARNTLDSAKLNMEIRGAMDLMVEEIRRAGYGGEAFMVTGSTDLGVQGYDGGVANCLLYSYDEDANGELATTSATEYFGFRIADNAIAMRVGGSGDLSSCANGAPAWQPVTDPNVVQIDEDNTFAIDYQCIAVEANTSATEWPSACSAVSLSGPALLLETRMVTIDLRGGLTRDATMSMDLTQDVLVRNHRVVEVPAP
jgi:prepilin peptidase dependent protein B